MPSNRRRTRQAHNETPEQNDSTITQEQTTEVGAPVEGAVQEQGADQETQVTEGQDTQETVIDGQDTGAAPIPTVEEQEAAEMVTEDQEAAETVTERQEPAETAAERQEAAETAAERQEAAETAAERQEARSGLAMTVQLHTGAPVEDVVATADVTLGDVCTIRNVKIKEDDYGLKVVMPRTKMPDTGRFKDACYFHTPELREQFDAAVKEAYQQTLEPAQEQGGIGGMTM